MACPITDARAGGCGWQRRGVCGEFVLDIEVPYKESNAIKSSTTNLMPVQCSPVGKALEEVP
jgi:hypothetical protein